MNRAGIGISRRVFIAASVAGCFASRNCRGEQFLSARAATKEQGHHFFGCYDKSSWDISGRYLLANESQFIGRQIRPGEKILVGFADLACRGLFRSLAETSAWCWQQGAMLRWLPDSPDRKVIYNVRNGLEWGAEIVDIFTRKKRRIPFPVYNVNHDGSMAVSLNFSRLAWTRPGYGYRGIIDKGRHISAPTDDGLYLVDLRKGTHRLIFSIADLARYRPKSVFAESFHWVNHLRFNQDGSRFIFLHRWRHPNKGSLTRLYTADPDGRNLRLLLDHGMVSHFIWRDPETILAWARHPSDGDQFYLVNEKNGKVQTVGKGILTQDGHCSFSPDGKWILTDTDPDPHRNMRTLMLYNVRAGEMIVIGEFYSPPELTGPYRCDLQPRWNRDGTKICIDSAHGKTMQMYIIDVSRYTDQSR